MKQNEKKFNLDVTMLQIAVGLESIENVQSIKVNETLTIGKLCLVLKEKYPEYKVEEKITTFGSRRFLGKTCIQIRKNFYTSARVHVLTLLAKKMLYLLQHPEERKRMSANASRRYLDEYSLPVNNESFLVVLPHVPNVFIRGFIFQNSYGHRQSNKSSINFANEVRTFLKEKFEI